MISTGKASQQDIPRGLYQEGLSYLPDEISRVLQVNLNPNPVKGGGELDGLNLSLLRDFILSKDQFEEEGLKSFFAYMKQGCLNQASYLEQSFWIPGEGGYSYKIETLFSIMAQALPADATPWLLSVFEDTYRTLMNARKLDSAELERVYFNAMAQR